MYLRNYNPHKTINNKCSIKQTGYNVLKCHCSLLQKTTHNKGKTANIAIIGNQSISKKAPTTLYSYILIVLAKNQNRANEKVDANIKIPLFPIVTGMFLSIISKILQK